MSRYGQRYPDSKEHEFCLGVGAMTGADKLKALLRTVAPPKASGPWYDRSIVNDRRGKVYMSVQTSYHDNLLDAVMRWDEPLVGQEP